MLFRFILWLFIIYFVARFLGAVIREMRKIFSPSPSVPDQGVGQKRSSQEFNNVEDADFEDITDKK